MADRSRDWLAQAIRDLEQARSSQSDGRHEWACFAAHQAAEKAVKALHPFQRQKAWGHMVAELIAELSSRPPEDLINKAHVLDNFYIPTRYPPWHSEGAPFEHYGHIQSENAIQFADEILQFARSQMV
ncbi:MAG: HEPN domain-containing protein [Deltaproteobacteria bacterium]|nr:HEPN domain-containing protein [Deltaproteobacteria bacterium]